MEESIAEYWSRQKAQAVSKGTPSSGQTKNLDDGAVQKISPYYPGEVIQSETMNPDGSIHYTTINSSTGMRHSYDVDKNGTVKNEHTTWQKVPKGDPDRHK